MTISRRNFLGGCASVCALNGVQFSLSRQALANTGNKKPHIFIHVFLRGGMDGLNLFCPNEGEAAVNYKNARETIHVPPKEIVTLTHKNGVDAHTGWGFNPEARAFAELWQEGALSVVHACGMKDGLSSRSHFDAQKFLEHGITANGDPLPKTGWLGRYLSHTSTNDSKFPAFTSDVATTDSLAGFLQSASIASLEKFTPNIENYFVKDFNELIKREYSKRNGDLAKAVTSSLDVVDLIANISDEALDVPKNVKYPRNYQGNALSSTSEDFRRVAKVIRSKMNLGLNVATINFGGWDTHVNQGEKGKGRYGRHVNKLSQVVKAFYDEMEATGMGDRYTMVIQSEFGRRVNENGNRGTDHGTGNILLVVGKNIKERQLHGIAPTLKQADLFQGEDIEATTDYRKVFYEILGKGFNVDRKTLGIIFPGYKEPYPLLGIMDGKIIDPPEGRILFSDSFEQKSISL